VIAHLKSRTGFIIFKNKKARRGAGFCRQDYSHISGGGRQFQSCGCARIHCGQKISPGHAAQLGPISGQNQAAALGQQGIGIVVGHGIPRQDLPTEGIQRGQAAGLPTGRMKIASHKQAAINHFKRARPGIQVGSKGRQFSG
jgi:hypothetical protein